MIRSLSQISGWGLGSSEVSGGGFLAYRRISQYSRHFCFASSECLARGGGGNPVRWNYGVTQQNNHFDALREEAKP